LRNRVRKAFGCRHKLYRKRPVARASSQSE
jgi:hypothetical protein